MPRMLLMCAIVLFITNYALDQLLLVMRMSQ